MSHRIPWQSIASAAVVAFSSIGSLNASDFYVQVGAANWRSVPAVAVPSATAHANPNALGYFETSTGYAIGAGYTVNERWSLEANYSQAPTVKLLIGHAHGILYPQQQQVPAGYFQETTIKTHVFSAAPAFELAIGRFTSVVAKLGIVHAQRTSETSLTSLWAEASSVTVPRLPVDSSDTHIFLSAGMRAAFPFARNSSTGMSYQRYFGIGKEFGSAVVLDIRFKF